MTRSYATVPSPNISDTPYTSTQTRIHQHTLTHALCTPARRLEGFICDHCNNVQNLKFNEKIILFGTDDNFKSDNVLDLLFCMQNILSIVADMKKSNLGYVH